MLELDFSLIADDEATVSTVAGLLKGFEQANHVQIKLTTMTWDEAWTILLTNAIYGKGPHVSHVGSTWSTPLAAMQALRAFTPQDLQALGAPEVFVPAAWQSATIVGEPQVWAVPWTTYAYILYFRRDILEQASIDEKTAFASAEAFDHTLGRLQAAGVEVPWVLPTAPPYLDLVHIAASWVRGAGGAYISEDGTRSLLGQPKTIAGFKAFFDLYRYIPGSVRRRNMDQCLDLFARGGAAMIVTGAEMGASVLGNPNASPRLRDNLGTCVLPGVPWIGGDNLVIWRHTSGYPEVEEMAFALVKYLTSYDVQVRYSRALYNLPSRRDAFPALEHPVGSLSTTLEQVIHAGRAHPSVRLWARVEYQLGESLDQVVQQILINPSVDLNDILPGVLNGTSWRLDLILKN